MYIIGQTTIINTNHLLNEIGVIDLEIDDFEDYIGINGITKDKCFLLKVRTSPISFWKGASYADVAWTASKDEAENIRNKILEAFRNGAKDISILQNGETAVRN